MSLKKLIIPIGIGLGMGAAYTPWGERLSASVTALAVSYRLIPEPAKPVKIVTTAPVRLRDDPSAEPRRIGEDSKTERDYVAFVGRLRFDEAGREERAPVAPHPDAVSELRSTVAADAPLRADGPRAEASGGSALAAPAMDGVSLSRPAAALGGKVSAAGISEPVATSGAPGMNAAAPSPGTSLKPGETVAQLCKFCSPGDPMGVSAESCLALQTASL